MVKVESVQTAGLLGKIYSILTLLPRAVPWFYFCRPAMVRAPIMRFFKALRAEEGADLPIGVAGFCWGGYWTFQLCQDVEKAENGKSLVDCGFTAHPSMLKIPTDAEAVKLPVSVAVGTLDAALPKDKADVVRDVLNGKTKKGDGEHEFTFYEGAHHGFAVRGSDSDPKESQMGLEAEKQAIDWFSKWFAK